MKFKEKLLISWDLTVFNRKNWKNVQKIDIFSKKLVKTYFYPISSGISKILSKYKIVDLSFFITTLFFEIPNSFHFRTNKLLFGIPC